MGYAEAVVVRMNPLVHLRAMNLPASDDRPELAELVRCHVVDLFEELPDVLDCELLVLGLTVLVHTLIITCSSVRVTALKEEIAKEIT
jgi:hypothetical protein